MSWCWFWPSLTLHCLSNSCWNELRLNKNLYPTDLYNLIKLSTSKKLVFSWGCSCHVSDLCTNPLNIKCKTSWREKKGEIVEQMNRDRLRDKKQTDEETETEYCREYIESGAPNGINRKEGFPSADPQHCSSTPLHFIWFITPSSIFP